jgi:hypothetical protein
MRVEKRRYQCDRSGEMFEKLHKQYEWAGEGKIWTGLWVGYKYLDKPQDQLRTPIVKADPKPVPNPRPFGLTSSTPVVSTVPDWKWGV